MIARIIIRWRSEQCEPVQKVTNLNYFVSFMRNLKFTVLKASTSCQTVPKAALRSNSTISFDVWRLKFVLTNFLILIKKSNALCSMRNPNYCGGIMWLIFIKSANLALVAFLKISLILGIVLCGHLRELWSRRGHQNDDVSESPKCYVVMVQFIY